MTADNPSDGEQRRIEIGDYELVPESESAARAASVLPTEGSEDVSHLLAPLDIPEAPEREFDEYLPEASSEWIVHVDLLDPGKLAAKDIAALFDQDWRNRYGGLTIYGQDAATDKWTFLISADGPETVTALQMAWPYYTSWSNDREIASVDQFESRLEAVKEQLATLTDVKVHAEVPPAEAHDRAKTLAKLGERLDRSVVLQLKAPPGRKFSGKDVWDVMLCLGLRWGDMDCFHWVNESGVGDDYLFSIETSTPPGYFLPEEIAADRVHVQDLLFIYSIPRCPAPVTVFDRMVAAAEYAKNRLGGEILLDGEGRLDAAAARKEIQEIVQELESAGFPPGSDDALRFF